MQEPHELQYKPLSAIATVTGYGIGDLADIIAGG
jgi:hypothetical protein